MRTKAQSRAPLALAAAAFACGIWLAGYLHHSYAILGRASLALAACAFAALAIKSLRLAQASVIFALICAGAFARLAAPAPHIVVPPEEMLEGAPVEITAHVIDDGTFLAGSGTRERIDFETESIELNHLKFLQPVHIRATIYPAHAQRNDDDAEAEQESPERTQPLAYGDRIQLTARLRLPRNFHNPGSFDYEGYLHGRGISTLATVSADSIQVLPGTAGSRLGFWRSRMRQSILAHIRSNGLWNHEDAALFSAMIVGDDSLLLRNVREEFQQTGVYHLLVVSGMNVGILAFAVFWLARRLRLPEWAASLVTIALSVFYAYIAGFGVPIVRAVLMLSLFLIARLLYRDRSGLNATGFAALIVLVLSPAALFDPGFQLTFLALLAITGISLPILDRTSSPYRLALQQFDSTGYDLGLEPRLAQFRLDLRLIVGRIARLLGAKLFSVKLARFLVTGTASIALGIYELLLISAITQAVLVLPMRAYFHRATILGLPANILVLPLAGIMLNAGVAAIALSYVSLPVARLAAWIASAALHWTLACLHSLSQLHISQWRTADPSPLLFLVAATGILLVLFAVRRRRVVAFAGMAALFISSGIVAVYHPAPKIEPGKLEITAIDVGQGDSLLVISPEGKTMLIDGGGSLGPVHGEFDFGEDVVAPYLWSRGIEHLDVVVLTHAHSDHIGGLPRIVADFHPPELWVGINPATQAVQSLYKIADANHTLVRKHVAGEQLNWGGAQIRILSPPADWQPKATAANDDSLTFLVRYGESSALLAGDLQKKMERFVATESPQADLLKVAHHGSSTSTTPELLSAVHPKYAVISAGYRNSFGHPTQEVLDRLQADHIYTYCTAWQGAITFLLDGKKVQEQSQQ